MRIPIPRVSFVCRLDQSTQRGQAALGITSHTVVLTELPNAHVMERAWGLSVQFISIAQSCLTLSDPMDCSTPGLPIITNSWSLRKLMSIESVMPSNHLILCHPLLLLPSIFPSIRVFSRVSSSHQVVKVLEFQLQHQSFQ